MCGIAGAFAPGGPAPSDVVREMARALSHRGPDDEGLWSERDAGVTLGHRRLSIVDLSPQGRQPMLSADGRYVLAFNGEIYNHRELRAELETATGAVQWRGHSDTEVMLAAVSLWGIRESLRRAVGMFAIALWDRTERRLVLARDRMGEKPVYYAWWRGAFLFASELKALKRYPGFAPRVDRRALTLFLRYLYVPAPYSIYSGVHKLEPGCMLELDARGVASEPAGDLHAPRSGDGVSLERWWALREAVAAGRAQPVRTEREALHLVESRLREAIGLQSLADVPLGAFLSGGVDSSLIAALMQSQCGSRVRTFTVGFEEKAYDEAPYAAAVARHLGTDHVELRVSAADALAVIPRLPVLYDEPFADSSQIPTFLLCSQARRHLTVALSGDAGDELFGGYNRYFWVRRIWRRIAWAPPAVRQAFGRALAAISPESWDRLFAGAAALSGGSRGIALAGDKAHKLAESIVGVHDENQLFFNVVSQWRDPTALVIGGEEPDTPLAAESRVTPLAEIEERMMYLDALSYLPDDVLVKVDRAAMAVSLETRAPFLDHRVVEAAWRLPLGMKLRGGQGKWALRQILYKYVPRELIERPKQGFGVPLAQWLRGPLRDWAEGLLAEKRLAADGYLQPAPIREKWRQHLSGERNWDQALWGVLMFEAWREAAQ